MFGCLRRVGCLIVLVVIAGAGYYTRHRWLPLVTPGRARNATDITWKPLTAQGAQRARRAIARLNSEDGPVFSNVSADEFASFLLDSASQGFVGGDRPAQAALQGDRVLVRTTLRIGDLGVENVPFLGGVAGKTATVTVGGTLSVERPGLGEWHVKSIEIDALDVPGPMITRVTRALATRMRLAGTRDGAFGFALPPHIADVRVDRGTITLYKGAR